MSLLLALTQPTGYTLAADAGSYAVSGTAAAVAVGKVLQASAGAYAVSGVSAGIAKTKVIAAGTGAYNVTGAAASISRTGGQAETASGGFFEYPMRRRPVEIDEPEVQQVIEQEIETLAVEAKSVMSAVQMQQHLESIGLAYKQAYLEIYMGLVEEIRQEKENEAIAACIAAML